MLFQSAQFLIFFPLVTLLYFRLPPKGRGSWLLAASLFFYLCWDLRYLLLLLAAAALSFAAGLLIGRTSAPGRKKLWLAVGFAGVLSLLFFFKYVQFALDTLASAAAAVGIALAVPQVNVLLPAGISFYTFQALGYLMDVYRGQVAPERSPLRFALFMAFFPKLISGPIERAADLLPQMRAGEGEWGLSAPFDFERMRRGLLSMVWGMFLKLVLADRLALLVDTVFPAYWDYNGTQLAAAAVCFSLQLYCDFAGYTAIAQGAAQVMGFRLTDNFRQPYLALSIREFWQRWHISLSSWFRDYLYIPLGGSRRGTLRTCVNTMVTMLVSGLWHGASWHFVVWGGLHGAYQVAGKMLRPLRERLCAALRIDREAAPWRAVRCLFTFALVTIAWIFFRADSTRAALGFIARMVTHLTLSLDGITELGLDQKDLVVAAVGLVVLLAASLLAQRGHSIREAVLTLPLPARWAVYYIAVFSVLIFGIYGGAYDPQAFIYGQQF